MKYPIVQYTSNERGSTSSFRGLNRTPKGTPGEWKDMDNIDCESYPCLSPRRKHSESLPLSLDGSVTGKICCSAEPINDSEEYSGFTGVLICDNCVGADGEALVKNFVFVCNGKVIHVGPEPTSKSDTVPDRTALWIYDIETDGVTADEITEFNNNLDRVIWTVAAAGTRYAVNGYDPVLKRGKYFVYNTKKLIDKDSYTSTELERTVVPSTEQVTYSKLDFYNDTSNDECVCVIKNRDEDNKLSDRFSEGDYLQISGTDYNDTHPYAEYGYNKKYAVVKEIVESSMDDGSMYMEEMYYYVVLPNGKFAQNTRLTNQTATIGIFVPPMKHIGVFGRRIWGVNPEEDSVYASVFDTPFKLINTDAQLDNAMSWQTELGTADKVVGVVPAASEMLVMKSNSLMRITGTNASNFNVAGVYKNCGCIDIESCVEASGTVYYLGKNGFYAYSGAQPTMISDALNCRYSSAVCTTDGIKYYASAVRSDTGGHEFLVYHIRSGTWYKWTNTPQPCGFFHIGVDTYAAYNQENSGAVISLCTKQEAERWQCESVMHFESTNASKGVNELWIRAEIKAPTDVYTRVNGGEWISHKELKPQGRIFCYKIPVRLNPGDFWQYKLVSSDAAIVYNIERIYDEGGGRHYVYN